MSYDIKLPQFLYESAAVLGKKAMSYYMRNTNHLFTKKKHKALATH